MNLHDRREAEQRSKSRCLQINFVKGVLEKISPSTLGKTTSDPMIRLLSVDLSDILYMIATIKNSNNNQSEQTSGAHRQEQQELVG